VEISEFVAIESIGPVYFDKTYYLSHPDKAQPSLRDVTEAIKQAGRAASAAGPRAVRAIRWFLRESATYRHAAACTMRPEVSARERNVDIPKPEVKPAELKSPSSASIQQDGREVRCRLLTRMSCEGRIRAAIPEDGRGKEISGTAGARRAKEVSISWKSRAASLEKTRERHARRSSAGGPRKAPTRRGGPPR